jgi:2-succinyl-5-enolpyruvyl-6-hydroxy-3-cyclohexene-1-carboxylate synthase
VVAHYDVGLRLAQPPAELVLRVGDTPSSKPLREWLAGVPQVVVDPHGAWHEPTRRAELVLDGPAAPLLDALADAVEALAPAPAERWLEAWRAVDRETAAALAASPDPFEPRAWAALEPALPEGAIVWVASSMPVRDVEAFFPSSPKRLRFLANRGANGIDGTVSSAAGAALACGRRAFLLCGELALLHDLGGLLAAGRAGAELTVVCANNAGGGIFDFLPVAEHTDPELYERHIATPSGVDLGHVATLAGLPHRPAATPDEIRAAIATPALVEVRTDRAASVREHRRLIERVAAALGPAD